ncbi:Uncharacterized mitochondrial protein AtMg00310 [Linum grandiflorum]
MDFWDLRGFNMALLTKQLWSLHNLTSSLIAKILKVKYFPNSSILNAELGYHLSFIWRRLFSTQEFLCRGHWRVGNGSSICIWGDRWIPYIHGFSVPSPPAFLAVDASVRELIDPATDFWDSSLLECCFPSTIAQAILQIPIWHVGATDCLIWSSSRTWVYITKDGYHAWMDEVKEAKHVAALGQPEM